MTPNEELDLARAIDVHEAARHAGAVSELWDEMTDSDKQVCISIARAVRLGDEERGLRVVPVEATEEMQVAGWIDKEDVSPAEIWTAMLAASPFAPEEKQC